MERRPYTPAQVESLAAKLAARLRQAIAGSGKSQQQIARETLIPQPVFSRFLAGGSLKLETVAVLIDYFGWKIEGRG